MAKTFRPYVPEQTLRLPPALEDWVHYSRRKAIVEPVFGQIKQARGFRQFLRRGLERVSQEWTQICLAHNLLKLYGATAKA